MMNSQNPNRPIFFTEHGIPIRNLWHMLLYAWNEPITNQLDMAEIENAPTLDALFARVLIQSIQQRMRIGLGRGYVDEGKRLRAVRGRISFPKSLKQQTFQHGEAECDFQQYSIDEPRNRIIRSTLARLVQDGEFGPDHADAEALRHRLRWLVRNLDGVEFIELSPDLIRRQLAAQNDHDYRMMLAVCELLLMRQMPLESDEQQHLPHMDREGLLLHRVYERFVANFYRMHLKGWNVSAQKRLDWHADSRNEHLPAMIPDLVLQKKATAQFIVLDTKFTARSLVDNHWDKPVYDSSHLYQLYAYLRSQEHISERHRGAVGILLYPAVDTHLSEKVELQDI